MIIIMPLRQIVHNIIDRLHKIPQMQRKRYQLKGPTNSFIALFLLFGSIWLSTTVVKQIWPEHVENKADFYAIGSISLHLICCVLAFLFHLPGYLGISQFHKKNMLNPTASRPWQRSSWKQTRASAIKNLLMNQIIVYPLFIYGTSKGTKVRFDDFPSASQVFVQLLIVYYIQDLFFHWTHRLFHKVKFLYKMHKIHHEYDTLYTWLTEYFHPVDFIIGNVMPSAMGFIFLGSRAHCFMTFYWVCYKTLLSSQGHSGYQFKFSPFRILPLVAGSNFHDYHHSNNVGTFSGSCYFWDLMTGTCDDYFKQFLALQPQKQDQAKKKQ